MEEIREYLTKQKKEDNPFKDYSSAILWKVDSENLHMSPEYIERNTQAICESVPYAIFLALLYQKRERELFGSPRTSFGISTAKPGEHYEVMAGLSPEQMNVILNGLSMTEENRAKSRQMLGI